MKRYESGLNGEEMAEAYLLRQGMTILERRYHGADGEIDLILRDGEYIVFAEVKYRPQSRIGAGLTAITPVKQRRMTHAALHFLVERGLTEQPVRFDAVEITQDGILHIPNAFMPHE